MTCVDAVDLTRRLIRCPSVTPEEGGALHLLEDILSPLGFVCHRLPFREPDTLEVENLYARLGEDGPNFCFAGHTDVVPVGDAAAWTRDPFAAEIAGGYVHGRGAVDMKGAIACFVAALSRFLKRRGRAFGGSISLLVTGDEEGVAINGTRKVLAWLAERGERLDACLVGEPTSDKRLGDMIKIGRRGAMNGTITVHGIQGHAAYAHLADNPVHHLVDMLQEILGEPLDEGSAHFPPSTLQITSIVVDNTATNVIPIQARAVFDCRFSDRHSSASVSEWLRHRLNRRGARYDLRIRVSGESFLTPPGPFIELVSRAVKDTIGIVPELGTTGGTSDARFIKDYCPVAELGLPNQTAHKVDERASLSDLGKLSNVYEAVLDGYFRT